MNNFWIPEEINLSQDVKDYPRLLPAERSAYDKILSFLVFLDSIQTANLPHIGAYITANEVTLCLSIQAFQECVHSCLLYTSCAFCGCCWTGRSIRWPRCRKRN